MGRAAAGGYAGAVADLEELGATQVEEEVRQVGEAGGPPKAGWVVLCEIPKLGGHSDEYPVYPTQHIKHILLTTPAHASIILSSLCHHHYHDESQFS